MRVKPTNEIGWIYPFHPATVAFLKVYRFFFNLKILMSSWVVFLPECHLQSLASDPVQRDLVTWQVEVANLFVALVPSLFHNETLGSLVFFLFWGGKSRRIPKWSFLESAYQVRCISGFFFGRFLWSKGFGSMGFLSLVSFAIAILSMAVSGSLNGW